MLFTFDVSFVELWQHLCTAGYWLIPIIGVWVLIYGINAASWWRVIKGVDPEAKVSPWVVYKLTISGYALNYATPVGGLGGEPYRIMELSKYVDKRKATSSVILYAMMHIFAHFWFWFSSIFLYLALAVVGDLPLNVPISCVLGFIALLFFGAFLITGMMLGKVARMALDDTVGSAGIGDRLGGMLLGAVRVGLVAVTLVLVFDQLVPSDHQPAFLTGSHLRPLLSMAGQKGFKSLPPEVTATIDRLKQERRI
jgi:hypothetical protein